MTPVPLLHHLVGRPVEDEHLMWLSSKDLLARAVGYEVKWVPGPGKLFRPEPRKEEHPVVRFHSSRARDITVRAPIRTSKSYAAAFECLHDGFPRIDPKTRRPVEDEIVVWLVGNDYETLKEWEYVWSYLYPNDFDLVKSLGGTVTQKGNTASQGNLRITIEWGRGVSGRVAKTIYCGKSSKNETSLQGEEVRTSCLSEAANHDERIVAKYLAGRSKRILKPTTPKRSAMWIYNAVRLGLSEEIVFTRECNPVYDWKRYAAEREKAILTWGKIENALDFLEQQEAEWVFSGGSLTPFRFDAFGELPSHIVSETDPRWDEVSEWLRFADFYISMDYGYTDEACALLWAVGPEGQKLILAEVYEKGLHNAAFINRMREVLERHATTVVKEWIPDPQKPELTKLLSECGLPVWTGMPSHFHRDRTASFRALIDMLSTDETTGKIPLLVHARCENTIREWKVVRKRDDWTGDEFAKAAIEGRDHALDAARYGALAIRHYRAQRNNMAWVKRHEEAFRERLDREESYRSWVGIREARV